MYFHQFSSEVCDPIWGHPPSYLWAEVLGLPPNALWHFSAAGRQVKDGSGCHVGSLHVMTVVKAALAAGAAGTTAPTPSASLSTPSSSSTAQIAAAAAAATGSISAGGTTGWTGVLAVTFGCKTYRKGIQ